MMKNYTQKTTKRNYGKLGRMMMLAVLMLCGGRAWAWAPTSAGTYYLRSTGTGNNFNVYTQANGQGNATATNQTQLTGFTITGGTYRLVFENTNTIIMNGQIYINASATTQAHLIMELGTAPSGSNLANPTMKIIGMTRQQGSGQDVVFFLANIADSSTTDHTITIQGNDDSGSPTFDPSNPQSFDPTNLRFNNNFVIDGDGPVLTAVEAQTMSPQVQAGTDGSVKNYGMFRIQQGGLHLKNVTVQNFSTTWANGGTVQVFTNNQTAGIDLEFDHCLFTSIGATNASVLRMQGNGGTNEHRDASIKYCRFENTFGSNISVGSTTPISTANATIRTFGNNKTPLTIEYSHINQNYGCPVRWHGCGSSTPMGVQYCLIENNFTMVDANVVGGGGLLLKGPAQIQNCTIRNNRTNGNGGGIYLSTYTDFNGGTIDLIPEHSILKLDSQTKIYGNIAQQNGGGVAIEAKRMFNNYYQSTYLNNTYGYIYWTAKPDGTPNEPFRVEFQQNGGKIYDNTANGNYGGGVFINRENQCTYYGVVCKLDYGEITDNTAANGGGVAIVTTQNYSNPSPFPSNVEPQNVTVEVSGASQNQPMLIQDNTASTNGGGIYVQAYPLTYNNTTSTVTTNVLDYTIIDNNTAATHGGGLFVQSGTVGILKNNENGSHKPTFTQNKATGSNGGGVYLYDGSVNMKGAVIGGSASTDGNTAGTSGGGIFVNTGSVTMESTTIQYNKAENQSGGGIFVERGDVLINPNENETTSPTKIDHNTANLNGGGIYDWAGKVVAFGSFDGDSTYRVQISHNTATTGMGGGIYCKGDTTSSAYDIRMRRVRLEGNTSGNHGGGIYLEGGKVSIINGWLLSNTANGGGGGIYTNKGDIDINITGEERQPSRINGNKAKLNGGGLNTHSGFITVRGKSKNDRIQIIGNVAGDGGMGSGGGAFCMGSSAEAEYITMTHVDLFNNEAKGNDSTVSNVTMGSGGGIYLQQGVITVTDVAIQGNKAQYNGGGINNHSGNIDVNGCLIGGAEGKGNQAGNSGGGIYTNYGDINIEDYVETEGGITRYESKITYNEAAKNGGGIDTRQGTITINGKEADDQIEVAYNKADKGGGMYANAGTIKAYNALIHDNTAFTNGGGINNHSGDITLYGGMLSNNTAKTGHGGGAYTNVGDIDLFQFPSTKLNDVTLDDGTKIYNNIALKNGGAFNNHTGRVDVRHATLFNNTSTQGNGGAIFCEGPHANSDKGLGYTIRLLCSDMVQNKTRGQDGTAADPTGRGGGIYLKYGSIYAHYSNILNNEANIAGGGLNNHEGNILLYGCDIIGNRAIELDGGGIFAKKGNITTGPSAVREVASTPVKATVIQKNTAHYNGGGIYNHEGLITLNGDLIGGNTPDLGNTAEKGNGGGVYIADGTITMAGGNISNNKANKGKGGGVYSGGGNFNIQERDSIPAPIVLIVDTKTERVGDHQQATIHYHLVDQGKYTGISNVQHGIIWGDDDTEVVYNDQTQPTGYHCEQGEPACQRITILNLGVREAAYKAKAFFRYTYNGTTYTGLSEEMEFVAFSDVIPLVLSGAVSNITKNSASGSGKLMDKGGSNIVQRGAQLWTDNATPPVDTTGTLYPSSDQTDFFTVDLRKKEGDTYVDLNPNTTYYARAYATNNDTIGYGATVEFKTLKATPDMGNNPVIVTDTIENDSIIVKATFTMPQGSNLTNPSGNNYIKGYGFVWSTDDDPELISDHTTPGTLGSDSLTFTASYRGARQNICAYVRAYATYVENNVTNASDITDYSITTPTPHYTPYLNGAPVVRAIELSNITQTSVTATCKIYSGYNYEGATTKYGVHLENNNSYHASTNYNPDDSTYTVNLTGLTVNTTYYLKAYATNDDGTTYSYGNSYNFTTLPIALPHVNIESVSDVTRNSARITCSVEDGGGAISRYGLKWGTDNPPTQNDTTIIVSDENPFITPFSILLPGDGHTMTEHTTYYVQAYATNSAGTHTCSVVSFTTEYDKPSISDFAITNIGFDATAQEGSQDTARANFKVKSYSTQPIDSVKTYGVCWSILHSPTRRTSDVSDTRFLEVTNDHISSADPQSRSILMTQRFPNTKYYVRAYASVNEPDSLGNLTDIVYEPNLIDNTTEVSFITPPAMVTNAATNVGKTSATLSGQIASRDSEGYLVNGYYGVCWGTTENPTRVNGFYTERQITAANANVFSYSLPTTTELTSNATYHYRAYYKSASGNLAYGTDKTFQTKQHGVTATVNPTSGGNVNIVYSDDPNNNTYSCTVTATANMGYTFTNWTENGNVVSTNANYTFTVTGDRTLVANFTANTYTINVVADPAAGGTVSGGGSVSYGSSVTLTATANANYEFVNWTLGGEEVSSDATYTFNYNFLTDTTFVAHFTTTGGRSRSQTRRSRDIYPAPAREPWDWDEETIPTDTTKAPAMTDTLPERHICTTEAPRNIPMIDHNTAEFGGGVYVDKNEDNPAKIVFAGGSTNATTGTINQNYATEAGGGVYISEGAAMQMKGHCQVNSNHVLADKKGGGIYLDGVLKVGENPNDADDAHALQVNLNWAGAGEAYSDTKRNNVYLPTDPDPLPTTDENLNDGDKQRVITLLSDISGKYEEGGTTNYYSKIGLSVDHGYRAVIYTSLTEPTHEDWLTKLIISGSLSGAIFDDANLYYALHIHNDNNPDQLKPQYDYLYGCWTTAVSSNPNGDPQFGEGVTHFTSTGYNAEEATNGETWHIYTKYGLAWFTSYVNGLNECVAHPNVNAILEADIDMSEHLWVPIGSVAENAGSGTGIVFNDGGSYTGEFNGQGNLINGLKCYFVTGIKKYGLFGTVTSLETSDVTHIGKVKNTFVDNLRFYAFKMGEEAQYQYAYRMGGIASELEGSAVISACEARGVMNTPAIECDVANTYKGGLVGKMSDQAIIHSSMAMPEMSGTAKYVGGLVGELGTSNKLLNSFSNLKFPDAGYNDTIKIGGTSTNFYFGGLVGENNGLVENCYSRLQGTEPISNVTTSPNYNKSIFGWLAGTSKNGANILYCYAPRVANETNYNYTNDFNYVKDSQNGSVLTGHDNYGTTLRYSGKYGFKHRDHQMKLLPGSTNTYEQAAATGKAGANDTLIGGLQFTLNRWVDEKNAITETTSPYYNKGFADWTRTMASPINDDYPVPMLSDFNAVGSEDSIYMHYKHHVDSLISAYTKLNKSVYPTPSIYLYDTIKSGDDILPITKTNIGTTHPKVMLAINEDLGITVDGDAATSGLNARVGVTIKNDRKGSNDQTDNPNWHLFSSAINEVPIGLDYHTTEEEYEGVSDYYVLNNFRSMMQSPPTTVGSGKGIKNIYYWDRTYMDPPKTTWSETNVGYFPTNTPYGTWRNTSDNGFFDLYTYSEEFYHWVNFKREGKPGFYDHWHMDASNDSTHEVLPYQNELTMPKGKGYMMALSSESMMMADGELNTGDVYTYVTVTPLGTNNPKPQHRYDEPWRMLNMIGNPYQSYLDFEKFVNDTRDDPNSNSDLLYCNSYATRDDKEGEFIFYTMEQSRNNRELMASQYIHPHQGFFVKAKIPDYLKFTDAMRVAGTNTSLGSNFRDINYPLVNLICYEPSGHRDFTTVEVNRPELGGGSKMQNLRTGNASIYAHFEDNDYQTLFTPMGVSTVPVWFETEEDGVFTLRWNTLHGDFNYLHLIDHIMGTDIDCLTTDEYIFEAKTSDYESRFRLVFDCVGVEEYEEDDLNSATFAFQMGDELVINGEGMLQMFDISGRCLMSTQTMGQQSSVSLPKTAAGIYLLRLTTNSQVKVQKMVIK